MLLDNKIRHNSNPDYKIIDFISRYVRDGRLDLVTGYFSVSALAEISKRLNGTIVYRMILGHLMKEEGPHNKVIDLLSDDLTIERAIQLNANSKQAIEFLKKESVQVKTIQSAFCHAKSYIYQDDTEPVMRNLHIIGSSNLTGAGMGMYEATSNIELNHAGTGDTNDFKEVQHWFKLLWEQIAKESIKLKDGTKKDFKEYIIQLIEDLHYPYSPLEIYYKILYELFKKDLDKFELDPAFNLQIGHLMNTEIWRSLYTFQQKGVMSLIKMIKTHHGAILADAVGLGKTYQALAVMKYFEISEGCEVILLCPKKLEQNWSAYLKKRNSKFEDDKFDYVIRYHTDLQDERMNKDGVTLDGYFRSDRPKLFVIDESHNLRNDKSGRYRFLVDELLKKNLNVKVLLLSATPINTSLNDVRNQFKLMVKGNDRGFSESLDVPRLDTLFREANTVFKDWKENSDKKLSTFIGMLKPDFFRLTDALVMARTRNLVTEIQPDLVFPKRNSRKEDNQFITPENIGTFKTFNDLFSAFPPKLSAYQPSNYILREGQQLKLSVTEDEQLQDRFLVKMMYILLTKRLESSWDALRLTTEKVMLHHQTALARLEEYRKIKKAKAETLSDEELEQLLDEDDDELNDFTLGKREIRFSEIDKSGLLDEFEKDLKKDIAALEKMKGNLSVFKTQVDVETGDKSADNKLEKLIELIKKKQANGKNSGNKKVVIFTCYRDTALYLFNELKKRGIVNLACVTGQGSNVWNEEHTHKYFQQILERFAPFTKLFNEKKWQDFDYNKEGTPTEKFERWKDYLSITKREDTLWQINNPIDVLIATDCLSEGQNLQDADTVINYDVHWNPVRVLQRVGRIDRIGSPNIEDGIFSVNFWPSDSIENYIKLKERVEDRMVQMKIAGTEVDRKFSDRLHERLDDESIEEAARNKMLKSFELKWDDIDSKENNFGFDDLSLESFRQELYDLLKGKTAELELIPNGVYSGFKAKKDLFNTEMPKGVVALLAYPSRPSGSLEHEYKEHYLAYAIPGGNSGIINQKDILTILRRHKNETRFVPSAIEDSDEKALNGLRDSLSNWLDYQGGRISTQSVLKIMQQTQLKLDTSQGDADKEEQKRLDEKFRMENFDLITWLVIS